MKKRYLIVLVAVFLTLSLTPVFAGGGKEDTMKEKPLEPMTFITPRGTLEVMDDYNLWVAQEMGYFEELGINLIMEPGPNEALATTKFVSENQADVGYPSPGVLTSSVDTGMDIVMAFGMMASQVFNFSVKEDSDIDSVQDLAGKTISIWAPGGEVVALPLLVELGIDVDDIDFIYGSNWGQLVALGEADAALSWEGLRAQWDAIGLGLRHFVGYEFSDMPANGYAARRSDLDDPQKRQMLINFFKAGAMGIEFARHNPRAAAQITYGKFAAVREQMTPELALQSLQQLHWLYTDSERNLGGYGTFPVESWNTYLDIIYELGQVRKNMDFDDVATNELIDEINDFDRARVKADAEAFKLNDTWSKVKVTGEW